jgi:hypothetical protein
MFPPSELKEGGDMLAKEAANAVEEIPSLIS